MGEVRVADPAVREVDTDGDHSALFDLTIRDVTGLSWDYRGTNPLGHHGESENCRPKRDRTNEGLGHECHGFDRNRLTCPAGRGAGGSTSSDI